MDIHISLSDGVPIYQQIVTQVKYLVAAGRLQPGVEMPTIRALAEQLQVNPNTIARAYRELEQEGTVEKRSTKGTFVAESVSRFNSKHRQSAIQERIDQLLAESKQLGFSLDQLLEQIQGRARAMNKKPAAGAKQSGGGAKQSGGGAKQSGGGAKQSAAKQSTAEQKKSKSRVETNK